MNNEAGKTDAGGPRWRVRLKGQAIDLEDLAGLLTSPDVRVVRDGANYFLESENFESLTTSASVHDEALRLTPILNGIGRLKQHGYRDVEIDAQVVEFPNDTREKNAVVLSGSITPRGKSEHVVIRPSSIKVRVRLGKPTIVVDGQQTSPPAPGSLDTDLWAHLAVRDADVGEAIVTFGTPPHDWVNLYKILEIISRRADIVASGWASRKELERFKRTANDPTAGGTGARHARASVKPPPRPLTREEGVELIRRILVAWLASLDAKA